MRLYVALVALLALALVQGKPVDDDQPAPQESSDDSAKKDNADADKKDNVDAGKSDEESKPADDSAALSDSPITDPVDTGDKRDAITTTTTPPTTTTTTTVTPTIPTTTTTTVITTTTTTEPTDNVKETTTTAAPDADEPTVEGSDNNTRTMKGTTFHVAIQDKSVEFYDEMNTNLHDIHRHDFLTLISKIYNDDTEYKQAVIIKFSKPGEKDKDTTNPKSPTEGVVVDMYLRFYNAGKHLNKLTDALKTGKLSTRDVHPLFIRAYVAEPTGMVCTPDCKVQCYSYCDAGCCHVNIVQNIELPTPSPVEQFIANQQHALKTGQTTPKPCDESDCKNGQMQQQQPMIMPMPMMMPAPMPCQGPSCAPMMPQMPPQMPCQGAACSPPMMMPSRMPCQGAACAPPMMPPQMACQGAACPPPMMPPQMACQGAACPPPMTPPQMACQGAACPPPMMPPQMACQGAACPPPMMPPQMACQGAACAPPMMPQMCPPSCSQICGPSCPNQCCGGSMSPMGGMGMNQQMGGRRNDKSNSQNPMMGFGPSG